jgi:probable rRNA maturation factor
LIRVTFSDEGARAPDVRSGARRAVLAALRHERVHTPHPELLNIVWVSRERIRALNRRFRGKNRFTDVIAFRYPERGRELAGFRLPPGGTPVFGDLFIAPAQARLNARRFGATFRQELVRLCVHGTLHLLGYTDYVPREKKKMWAVQERILGRVGPR